MRGMAGQGWAQTPPMRSSMAFPASIRQRHATRPKHLPEIRSPGVAQTKKRPEIGAAYHVTAIDLIGSSSRTRTCDHSINSRMLYQLSYRGSLNSVAGL